MDPQLLQDLAAATASFVSAAEANDVEQAAKLLALRGELLSRAADDPAPLTERDHDFLHNVRDVGTDALLPLIARRHWLESHISDARKSIQTQNSLRPYRETSGGSLDVTS